MEGGNQLPDGSISLPHTLRDNTQHNTTRRQRQRKRRETCTCIGMYTYMLSWIVTDTTTLEMELCGIACDWTLNNSKIRIDRKNPRRRKSNSTLFINSPKNQPKSLELYSSGMVSPKVEDCPSAWLRRHKQTMYTNRRDYNWHSFKAHVRLWTKYWSQKANVEWMDNLIIIESSTSSVVEGMSYRHLRLGLTDKNCCCIVEKKKKKCC